MKRILLGLILIGDILFGGNYASNALNTVELSFFENLMFHIDENGSLKFALNWWLCGIGAFLLSLAITIPLFGDDWDREILVDGNTTMQGLMPTLVLTGVIIWCSGSYIINPMKDDIKIKLENPTIVFNKTTNYKGTITEQENEQTQKSILVKYNPGN